MHYHYKAGRGYQPVLALWAEQDLVIADELRDGNVPAGMEPLVCTKRAFEALPPGVLKRRRRGDTACYQEDLLKYLVREKIELSIGADVSRELRSICEKTQSWELLEERARETVDVAETEFTPGPSGYADHAQGTATAALCSPIAHPCDQPTPVAVHS